MNVCVPASLCFLSFFLGSFFFSWFVFILFYVIFLDVCLYTNERKGGDLDKRGSDKNLGGVGGGETTLSKHTV